jgi:Uma2 family endonuclease
MFPSLHRVKSAKSRDEGGGQTSLAASNKGRAATALVPPAEARLFISPPRGSGPMSVSIPSTKQPEIVYPESDGKPMAENTLEFQWIVTIKEGLARVFSSRPDIFVAGDLLWYPVEGRPDLSAAPDAMVAIGRPAGYRGCYKQWEEEGIAPQVVFEVLSPNNRPAEMDRKLKFYEESGVDEYYLYDPDHNVLEGWRRINDRFQQIPQIDGWVSPTLGIRFDMSGSELTIFDAHGQPFLSYPDLAARSDQIARERDQIAGERDQIASERDRLVAQLRAMGVEPSS